MMTRSKCLFLIALFHSCGLIKGIDRLQSRRSLKLADQIFYENIISPFQNKRSVDDADQKEASQCTERSKITYTSSTTASVDVRFPSIHTNEDDAYLCTGYKVPFENKETFIVKFTPHADMKQTHHMLVYGCETLDSQKPYWECSSPCRNAVTLFAWARNAPELTMPKDVGFSIGKGTKIQYIAVEMHFAKAFKESSCAGVTAEVTSTPQKYFAGIDLLATGDIYLPPHTTVPTPISCVTKISSPMHIFGFRTHAHTLGTVITGYRLRGNEYKMIGKGNPQWPQSFYPRVGGEIVIETGDTVMAQCIYNNTRDVVVTAGNTGSDEMCNMYLMYYTSDKKVLKEADYCMGMKTDAKFPATVNDLAPYPGYGGQDSIDAIANGDAKAPPVPPEHHHGHHGGGREDEKRDQKETSQCSERSNITYTSSTTASVDVRFPSIHTNEDDAYLCTGYKVPFENKETFIVKFTPHADMKQTHHMLVYGCETLNSQKPYWDCSSPCRRSVTLFAWARNAPELTLPKDVGFSIGKGTKIQYIAVQMHFAKAFKESSCAGVTAEVTSKPQKYFAGIDLLGTGDIYLPPHTTVPTPISCVTKISSPMHIFGFRTHAHTLSTVITGYRLRGNEYKMIGKGNPQWPQSFYPRVGGEIVIETEDIVMAQCIYNNTRDVVVTAGPTGSDEMCNMYLMYYTSDKKVLKEASSCWGMRTDAKFPATVNDLAPYPGYGGQDSIDAIANGDAKAPAVPPEHHHGHHGGGGEDEEEDELGAIDRHPVLSDDEIDEMLDELHVSNLSRSRSHGMPDYQGLKADLAYPHMQEGYKIGQVGGLVAAPGGSVYVFHRANRKWGRDSFDRHNRFTKPNSPIEKDTVYHLDKETGAVLHAWGGDQFFMPHGASLDHEGYLWLTDVAMHQVLKYPKDGADKPMMTLGVRMEPGSDTEHFCKPTDVAVDTDGTIFVSDGYCNGRVMKFSGTGKFLQQWGEMTSTSDMTSPEIPPFSFSIAHNIILCGPDKSELCVADRENGRIQCFTKDGKITRIIDDKKRTGTRIFAIAYSPLEGGVIFGVNGPGSITSEKSGGFTINYATVEVVERWQPSTDTHLTDPHDITASPDGKEVYVGDLSHKKVFKFNDIPAENTETEIVEQPHKETTSQSTASLGAAVKEDDLEENIDNNATATIIIVCLIAVPTIALIVSVTCVRMRANRMKEYESLLTSNKKSQKPLDIAKFRKAPERQGFKRISTESTDDESDVEVFSRNKKSFKNRNGRLVDVSL